MLTERKIQYYIGTVTSESRIILYALRTVMAKTLTFKLHLRHFINVKNKII